MQVKNNKIGLFWQTGMCGYSDYIHTTGEKERKKEDRKDKERTKSTVNIILNV